MIDSERDQPAAALYPGPLMHARLRPAAHRFRYRVMSLVIDIDRLDEAGAMSPLFSVGRFNVWSFHAADHGPGDGSPLRPWAEALLAEAGVPAPARIRVLCYPRLLGYVFDPLSIWFCEDAAGRTTAVIYSVRNTFGERHAYVCPVANGTGDGDLIRQSCDKRFYVSPFNPMRQRYHFRVQSPGDTVSVRILETDTDGPLFTAAFVGQRAGLTTARLLRTLAALPLMTFKVIAAIHFEALRLWLKGVPVTLSDRVPVAAPASLDGRLIDPGQLSHLRSAGVPHQR